jgi:DNA-binding transcriptional ArsR family regulator
MDDNPDIPRVAQLLADPARARMLWLLIDGTMRPAGELAYAANVSAQSASAHLAKLVEGGLLRAEAQGRHRYFRIASAEIAAMIEGVASVDAATRPRTPRALLPSPDVPVQFLHARTCYGHLAGEMAVKVLEAMLKSRWLAADGRDYAPTRAGEKALAELGVYLADARKPRRAFARACVDLTQRRPHLGGALGDALLDAYLERGWVLRSRRSRAVTITPKGREGFRRWLGVQ